MKGGVYLDAEVPHLVQQHFDKGRFSGLRITDGN